MERSLKALPAEDVSPPVLPEESCSNCHYMSRLKQFGRQAPACTALPPVPIGVPGPNGPQIVSVSPAVELDYCCSLFRPKQVQ